MAGFASLGRYRILYVCISRNAADADYKTRVPILQPAGRYGYFGALLPLPAGCIVHRLYALLPYSALSASPNEFDNGRKIGRDNSKFITKNRLFTAITTHYFDI